MDFSLQLSVEFDTPFNVGSGASGDTWANKTMVKDRNGLPLIPGSSLKGRLRQQCEQIANALNLEPRPCSAPNAETMCQPNRRLEREAVRAQLCPVCRVFGSPWYAGPVEFSDLRVVEPAFLHERDAYAHATVRYGVGISRHRRVAEDQLLYTVEVFQPGSILTLTGEVRGFQLSADDVKLLVAGLDTLFTLGGHKTRGMGWCRLHMQATEIKAGASQPLDLDALRRRWEA